ncbi:MAG: sigma-70 family RNA polymerase sigma factor [Planctomycetota bacterium]|nr:MAG: sigma-70 family RNA polymerase sigma factor [Planctomycetota bacterium]
MSRESAIQDALLVLRCLQGETAAFAALVDRWQERLLRHAARMIDDQSAARDITQETWIAVIKNLSRLDDTEAFGQWVFRILTNKCADWVRRQQRDRRLHDRLAEQQEQSENSSPATSQRFDSVYQAMDALPTEQGSLLALYYIEEFSVAEIAEIVGVPSGTIKSRLYRARNNLRQLLEDNKND